MSRRPRWTFDFINSAQEMSIEVHLGCVPGATQKQAEQNARSCLAGGLSWECVHWECVENAHARLDLAPEEEVA